MGNGVLAFLAAVGIAALVWLVTGVLLRRRPPEVPAVLVLPACGGAEAGGLGPGTAGGAGPAGAIGGNCRGGLRSHGRGSAAGAAAGAAV